MLCKSIVLAAAGLLASLAIAGTADAAVHPAGQPASGGWVMHAATPLASAPESFKNQNTGRCVDAVNASLIEGFGCSFEPDQEWLVTVFSDGTRMLQNELAGTCLAYAGPNAVFGETCDTRVTGEHWTVAHFSDGSIRFQNAQSHGCLRDSVSTQLGLAGCNTTTSTQRFR